MSLPIPKFKNGLGMFVPQVKRIVFNYCERSGSSKGIIEFLQRDLNAFAAAHNHVEIVVVPRPAKHPLVKGTFMSGREKSLCVKNMTPAEIKKHIRLLTDAADAGSKTPVKGGVISTNPAVRGIWTPFKQL
ncbi:39S ribosomal protein L51, mitochondrial [Blastocladiella emersonii ATCC 22665]|nr:39S ribosomal protein L51, mitochondrial [Blastocladiella emersonii ATCC 22665]